MKGSKRVLLGAASNWIRFIVFAAVSFILVPVMTKFLGSERYGLWTLSSSILGFLQALDAGFGAGTVKWTAEATSPEHAQRRDELLSTALAVHIVAAAAGTAAVVLLTFLFTDLFSIPLALAPEAKVLFFLLGVRMTVVGIPAGFYRGLIFGSDRLVLLNFVQVLSSALYGFVSYALLAGGTGLAGLALWNLASAALETAAVMLVAGRAMRTSATPIRLSFSHVSKTRFREAFSYSGSSFMVQVTSAILMQSDLIMLKFFSPLTVVAGYGIAQRATDYGLMLVKQAVNALTPSIARLEPEKEPEKARFFLANASKYAGAMAAILTVAAWTMGGDLLAAWAGQEYRTYGVVMGILMTAFLFIAVQMPCASFLSLKGDHVWSARAMALSALVNVAASIALAFPFKHVGIALGTLVASFSIDGIVLPIRAYHKVGMKSSDLVRRVWMKLVLPSAAECGAILLACRFISRTGLVSVLLIGALGTIVFLCIFIPFSLDASERKLFLGGKGARR